MVPQIDQLEVAFKDGVRSLSSLLDILLAWISSCKMQAAISVIMHALFIIVNDIFFF